MKAADLQYMQAEIIAQELSMGCPEGKKPADILQENRSGAKSRKADKRTGYNDLELHGAASVLSRTDGSEYPVAKGVGVLP